MNLRNFVVVVLVFVSPCGIRGSLDAILAPLPKETVKSVEASKTGAEKLETLPEISAPVVSEVEKTFYPISREDLKMSIEEEVSLRLRPQGDLTLIPLRPLPDLSAFSHPYRLSISGVPARLSSRTISLNVQVENDEGVVGKWALVLRPHLYGNAWYAKGHLRKGDLASPADFEMRRVDRLLEPNSVDASLDVLSRHEYSRDIRPGYPLEWNDLTERSLVRKGQVVDVMAYQGMIAITMRARASQNGVKGDMVFLQNLESNKSFTGEVIGEGRVQVTF